MCGRLDRIDCPNSRWLSYCKRASKRNCHSENKCTRIRELCVDVRACYDAAFASLNADVPFAVTFDEYLDPSEELGRTVWHSFLVPWQPRFSNDLCLLVTHETSWPNLVPVAPALLPIGLSLLIQSLAGARDLRGCVPARAIVGSDFQQSVGMSSSSALPPSLDVQTRASVVTTTSSVYYY